MKFTRFFGLFPAFLALVLLFSGCDLLPFGKDSDDNPAPAKDNGIVFVNRKAPGSKIVFLSIYSSPTSSSIKAAMTITPKTGDNYALAVITPDNNGQWSYSGPPDSVGTISVASGKITFKPTTTGQQECTGSISGDTLTMEKVPGTTFTDLQLGFLKEDEISASKPFGNSLTLPPEGGDTPDNNSPPVAEGPYYPGNIVKSIEVISEPTWKTDAGSANTYYEGDPINANNLKGIQVVITWDDGSKSPVPLEYSQVYSNFIIDPYDFRPGSSSGTTHFLYYNKGFANGRTSSIGSDHIRGSFSGPLETNIIKIASVSTPAASQTALQLYEDELYSGVKVNVHYNTAGTPSGRSPYSLQLSKNNKGTLSPDEKTLTVEVGSTSHTFSVSTVFHVKSITADVRNAFKHQVLFDDPRLINTTITDNAIVNAHWLDKLEGGSISVTYDNGTTKSGISMVDAYNRNAYSTSGPHSFIIPPGQTYSSNKGDVSFSYYGAKAAVEVPVFNTLASIYIVSSPNSNATPIMYKTLPGTSKAQFMSLIKVQAYYEYGKNGPSVNRLDTWAQLGTSLSSSSTDPITAITTNFDDDNENNFLKSVTSNYAKGKLTKATVTFTTNGVSKSNTIMIGAIGY